MAGQLPAGQDVPLVLCAVVAEGEADPAAVLPPELGLVLAPGLVLAGAEVPVRVAPSVVDYAVGIAGVVVGEELVQRPGLPVRFPASGQLMSFHNTSG